MKIGILTYHRAENYGGNLQAYALKSYLKNKGHIVKFIDYWPDYHAKHYYYLNPYDLKKRNRKGQIMYILYTLFSLPWLIKRRYNFRKFIKEYLGILGSPVFRLNDESCEEEYDAVIYGSDQIWRRQNFPAFEGYDNWYFGSDHIVCKVKIAYAASIGTLNRTKDTVAFFQEQLKNFSALSVREEEVKFWLEEQGYRPRLVSDPVFLLKKGDWLRLCKASHLSTGKYILFYNLLGTPESLSFAKRVAEIHNCEIRELTKNRDLHIDNKRYINSASVGEFLSLIANAEVIIGNSFHGVAFSILLEKEFYAVGMRHLSARVESLLSILNISERYIKDDGIVSLPIDYYAVNEQIELLRNSSMQYLDTSLGYL